VRVVNPTDLQGVTPDATTKDRFVLVDAVGVTETELIDVVPVERKRGVSFEKLLHQVALGTWDADIASSVAIRLARLNARLNDADRARLAEAAGEPITELAQDVFTALDPDNHLDAARAATGTLEPEPDEVAKAARGLMAEALAPIADHPEFRTLVVEIERIHEQAIDEYSKDQVIESGYSKDATDRARQTVESFHTFIEEHKDEITALQILYNRPYGARELTFAEIRELADAIELPPRRWTPERLWVAYETLEKSKVHGPGSGTPAADLQQLEPEGLDQGPRHRRLKTWAHVASSVRRISLRRRSTPSRRLPAGGQTPLLRPALSGHDGGSPSGGVRPCCSSERPRRQIDPSRPVVELEIEVHRGVDQRQVREGLGEVPQRARASTYQNVQIENVPSEPARPSGDAAGS
jgi:hypothetical protein